jgi:hypothetical protein
MNKTKTSNLKFRHQVIDPDPPGAHHDITLVADVNGDGQQDIIIGCKQGPANLFWYENPTWERHIMAYAPNLEAGGVVLDINGDGRPDVVAGMQWGGNELYWFENPPDPTQRWIKHVIEDRFKKYHDQIAGDVDGDSEPEILIASQQSGVIAYYDIPPDPYISPWPQECCHVIAEDMHNVEGLVIVDIDGDGCTEIIAGPNIFRPGGAPHKLWRKTPFAPGFVMTRVAVADLDGDGALEIVLSEGESHPGRLALCKAPSWEPRILRHDLFHPHSLEIADFNGDGLPDIFVAEMGLGRNPDPRMMIFINQGGGRFEEVIFQRGIPTHEAKVGDLTGDGRPDIVGKPYYPERHIDVWFNQTGK